MQNGLSQHHSRITRRQIESIIIIFGLACVCLLSACADGGTPRLEVSVAAPAEGDPPDSLIIFLRQGPEADARFGVALESLDRIGVDGSGRINLSLVTGDARRGTGLLYIVGCSGEARCDCLGNNCPEEQRALGPSCSCMGTRSFGVAAFDNSGVSSVDLTLRPMPSECDLDGDLFPRCDGDPNSLCCRLGEGLPQTGFWDCQDRPEDLPVICDSMTCDPAQAHPFKPNEHPASAVTNARSKMRHRQWCGDGLNNDCRQEADVSCGDFDSDGVPYTRGPGGDCDDDDPQRSPTAVEVCGDEIDQDCNGFDLPCDADMDGVSAEVDCDDNDPDRFPGNPERCGDGIDQDCNGRDVPCLSDDLDFDGFSCPVGAVSDPRTCFGVGQDCNDLDSSIHPGAMEKCGDGIDQDCVDGDMPCQPGDNDRDGFVDGLSGGMDCDDQDQHVYPGAPERCGDGIDQDCDGFDSDCSPATDHDGDGWPTPFDCNDQNPEVNPAAEEGCNAIDDNCDGIVDEGNPMRPSPAEPAVEAQCGDRCPRANQPCACRVGTRVCTKNGGSEVIWPPPCLGISRGDFSEVCNGIDDDCDGNGDQNIQRACYDGPMGTENVGLCHGGRATCDAQLGSGMESFGQCQQQTQPSMEGCNGVDDDCDGPIDEGFELGTACNGIGECGRGVRECGPGGGQNVICSSDSSGSNSQAEQERCDNRDNDCDGQTDENVRNACGDCGNPPREVCNGEDEDCDGRIDEGELNACGACGDVPDEVCNGRDDDCDNEVDEGELNRCGACGDEPDEVCNGQDDDCDNEIDEEFDLGEECTGTGQCGAGITQCSPDAREGVSCSTDPGGAQDQSSVEVCNGLDDDCDGDEDEGGARALCPGGLANSCDGDDGCRCGDDPPCDERANLCTNAGRCRCGGAAACGENERCVGQDQAGQCRPAQE